MRLHRWLFPVLLVALAAMTACKSEESRLEEIYATAGSGTGGRAAAGNALRKQSAQGKITIVEAVAFANDKLDSPGDAAAVSFAGAVLDTVEIALPDLESKTNELFWIQIGTLAGKASAVAFTGGDVPLARSLVLAGSDRWQTDAYWHGHPAHDATASLLMHKSGESKEALARLRERPELVEETQAAYDEIEREWRRSRGG